MGVKVIVDGIEPPWDKLRYLLTICVIFRSGWRRSRKVQRQTGGKYCSLRYPLRHMTFLIPKFGYELRALIIW